MLANQIEQIEASVAALERQLLAWHKTNVVSQRLASIPGIGPHQKSCNGLLQQNLPIGDTLYCHYSITSSARSKTDCGIATPSVLAVFMLITISILVGCSTGRSAGFAPFKILST